MFYILIQMSMCLCHLEDSDYQKVEVKEKLHVKFTLRVKIISYNIIKGAFEKEVMCILNIATATEWGI